METATQALHRLTSYEAGRDWDDPHDDPRVLHDFEPLDRNRFPWFFKRYAEDLPTVPLPRALPTTSDPAIAVLAGTAEAATTELDLPQLSRLLHLSAGVVRTSESQFGTWLFRAAGSAGGRFPLELYVAVPAGTNLPAGVHWYQPLDHALVQIGGAPSGDAPAVVVTGVPWRTAWKYSERGYRHVYWDSGTMLAQLLAVAESAGVPASLYTRFADAGVAELVGADRVHEWPVAVVSLGAGAPAVEASGPAQLGQVDAAPTEFPLATAAQRAGERDELGAPWDRGATVDVPLVDSAPVEDVVLTRSSQRLMDRTRSLPGDVVRTTLSVALRGVAVPHFVAVHAADGVASGLYRWPDLSRPVRAGDLRAELYRAALEQDLASDAAFVAVGAVDVAALDDREYREAQLAAGLVEGRLHVAAYALGASASGMTFVDSEIPALLGERLDGLLFTCVGVPENRSVRGGPPGAPAPFAGVRTRSSGRDRID